MGLLALVSNEKLAAQQAPVVPEAVAYDLSAHIRKQWATNREAKQPIEREMLEDLRQRNGVYDPDTLAEIREQGGSEIYMMLTSTKCRAAESWITDILLPAGDKAWSIEPTPIPELSTEIQQYVALRLRAETEELVEKVGVQPSPEQMEERRQQIEDRIRAALMEKAQEANDRMERKIEDQLHESGWESALMEFISDFVTFPTAVLKGPVYRKKLTLKWGQNGEPVTEYKVVTTDQRVSPFDIFPAPGAVDVNDGAFIERIHLSRTDLYEMIGVPGYSEEAIREVLDQHSSGGLKDWQTGAEPDIESLQFGKTQQTTDMITGLHYWGSAPGSLLMEWGFEATLDPQREYEIEAILVGTRVIRAILNTDPLLRRPYYKASFQRRPGSFWGFSPPRLMRDIQRMCNGTARSLSNNMGMSSGPQVVVMKDMLAQGETLTQIFPWKQWQMSTLNSQPGVQPIQFFQPQSNAGELLTVYKEFELRADDATNIPRYAYGNEQLAGAGSTAQGLAMLLEAASKGIKQAIRHIDDGVIRPRIERQYQHNMLYEDDPSIKGDLRVVARGSSALIAKAATQARRNEFLQITANPLDLQLIGMEGRAELLRQMVKDMDMNPSLVPEAEEIRAKQEQMAQQPQQQDPQMQIAQMKVEAEKAKLDANMQNAEAERQAKLAIAEMQRQGDMMELAEKGKLTLEQIKAKLGEVAIRERGARQRIADEAAIKARFGSGI